MKLDIFQVDAFTSQVLKGNPAAVIPLQAWLADDLLQSIANENNLSETAYVVPTANGFHIRWFTPLREVNLCGHATLAAAYVLFKHLDHGEDVLRFDSLSGELTVTYVDGWFELDFPNQSPLPCATPPAIMHAFAVPPIACLKSEDYIVVLANERQVSEAQPNYAALADLDLRGVAITAQSSSYDFITRFFAPKYGVNEDPVTGSAFTQLAPYWASVLKKQILTAKQVSARGGEVKCVVEGERVKISGQAVLYMQGCIFIKDEVVNA